MDEWGFGGTPAYALGESERTVTGDHVRGVPVRSRRMVTVARHYGPTVATSVPAGRSRRSGSRDATLLPDECAWAARTSLVHFVKAACTLAEHRDSIVNAITLGSSNGGPEAMNSTVRLISHPREASAASSPSSP